MARHKGTLYSIHRIVSPSLLLEKLWEFYELNPEVAYPSSLDQGVIDDASYKVRVPGVDHISECYFNRIVVGHTFFVFVRNTTYTSLSDWTICQLKFGRLRPCFLSIICSFLKIKIC